MSTFPVEPPVTPAAPAPEAGGAANRRELSQEEIATLPLQALLVRAGHITLDQLADALRENVATGRAVEDIALSRGWLTSDQLDALRAAKSYAAGAPAPVAQAPAAPAPVVEAPAPVPPAPVAQAPAAPPPVFVEAPAPPAPVVQAPPPPAPAPVVQAPAAPAPVVEAPAPRAPVAVDTSVGVFLNLEDGARIWAGRFDSLEDAERHARNLTESLVRPEPGVWPRFGDQLVRPDAVVSVEVSPREER
ncbi:MAG: hypothetical protein ABI717_09475 [Actinomycetota bacterium]